MSFFEDLNDGVLRLQFGRKQQSDYVRSFFSLLKEGVPLRDALINIRAVGNPVDQMVAKRMYEALRAGQPVARGMQGLFDPVVVGSLAAGEQTPNFVDNGLRIADIMESEVGVLGEILGKLLPPVLFLALVATMYTQMRIRFYPLILHIKPIEEWTLPGRIVYHIGDFFVHHTLIFFVTSTTVIVLFGMFLTRYAGPGRQFIDQLPIFSMYRQNTAAKTVESISLVLLSGMEMRSVLRLMHDSSPPLARLYLRKMMNRLQEGGTLADVIDVGFLGKSEMSLLKLLAQHRGFMDAMQRVSRKSGEAVLDRVRLTVKPVQAILFAVVGLGYGMMIFAVYTNTQNLQSL